VGRRASRCGPCSRRKRRWITWCKRIRRDRGGQADPGPPCRARGSAGGGARRVHHHADLSLRRARWSLRRGQQAAHLAHWWGAHGMTLTVCEVDARSGGMFKFCMRAPDGKRLLGRGRIPRADRAREAGLHLRADAREPEPRRAVDRDLRRRRRNSTRMTLHQKLFDLAHARAKARNEACVECLERLDARLRAAG
jgi:uncharacterized protein YndB with AHSA1/START domain